ncbi:MAG: nucleotidyltransferase family protein [Thermoanaerobaculia bacterium]
MISAIVLAAGQASRFGGCKQLVRLGEKTLLQHVLDSVNASKIRDVIVVLGAHADEIKRRVTFGRERIVVNGDHARGMSTSIGAGLRALPAVAEAAMFVLADQPFVKHETIDALVDEYERNRKAIVLPTYKGARGNPVVVDRSLFGEVAPVGGDVGFRAIFKAHAGAIAEVAVDDVGVVTDIDTRQQFDDLAGR